MIFISRVGHYPTPKSFYHKAEFAWSFMWHLVGFWVKRWRVQVLGLDVMVSLPWIPRDINWTPVTSARDCWKHRKEYFAAVW